MIDLERAASVLRDEGLDGWLLYDFQGQNPIARDAVLEGDELHTRRWFCLVRPGGPPVWLVHAVERAAFAGVPGEVRSYAKRDSLEAGLHAALAGCRRVCMEYSPLGNIPYVSRVDAGTIELVRAAGPEVVSSADVVQRLLAPWPEGGLDAHRRAARVLEAAVDRALALVGERIAAGGDLATECEVQGELLNAIDQAGLRTNHPPIVAVGPHSADAHFAPDPIDDRPIGPDEVLLLDIWAREPGRGGVYADVTFMAYTGTQPPPEVRAVWEAVRGARDAAIEHLEACHRAGRPAVGFEVDRVAREVIDRAGHGERFVHRTGHSLGPEDHWIGANLDDYETRDERRIVPGTGFTIEPGIYIPGRFGLRSEVDVFWGPNGPEVTTARQADLYLVTSGDLARVSG